MNPTMATIIPITPSILMAAHRITTYKKPIVITPIIRARQPVAPFPTSNSPYVLIRKSKFFIINTLFII